MSLTYEEQQMTREDIARAMADLGITPEQAAAALGTTPQNLRRVMRLDIHRLEDPWVLRNYLLDQAAEQHVPVTFRVLNRDYHRLWFLDAAYIDRGRIA